MRPGVAPTGHQCQRWVWLSTSSRTRKQVEHPALTTQARSLSAQYWVLELGDPATCDLGREIGMTPADARRVSARVPQPE